MRKLTVSIFIAASTFILGITVFTLWTLRYFNGDEKITTVTNTEAQFQSKWQKINIDNKASFYIPPGLEPQVRDTPYLYRSFRDEDMDILAVYYPRNANATCNIKNPEKVFLQSEWSKRTIDGRDASIGWVGKKPRDLEGDTPFLETVIICVPNVDGEYEFQMVAMYKKEQDYETVLKVINSIKFTQP
jgi:hypothetical protein